MEITHVALTAGSEENSDKFYKDLLGLEKLSVKSASAEIMKGLFDIDADCPMINYGNDQIRFEMFILARVKPVGPPVAHVCLRVEDRDALIARAREMGLAIRSVVKGEKQVVFIQDFDGNSFEIQSRE